MGYTAHARRIGGLFSLSVTLLVLSPLSLAANGPAHGVLALYDVKNVETFNSAMKAFENDIRIRGCGLVRDGRIVNENGDMDIDKPNRFLLLTCTNPLLRDASGRAVFPRLNAGAERIALLEGEAVSFPEERTKSPILGRAYILKLSRYNNDDPDGRDRELAEIRAAAGPRRDRWRREMTIIVSHAVGMATPDEVAVLFYDSPDQGERFRENNPDILKAIGGFNKRHLAEFIYYGGGASR